MMHSRCASKEVSQLHWLADFYRHPAEFFEDRLAPAEWPPVIQIYFHRPPHRHPTSNGEAFPLDHGKGPGSRSYEEISDRQAGSQKHHANQQAFASVFHQMPKLQPAELKAITEVVMDRFLNHRLGVAVMG